MSRKHFMEEEHGGGGLFRNQMCMEDYLIFPSRAHP
jgi:hypothetical protein